MKNYYRIMPGRGSAFAEQVEEGSFVGIDAGIQQDITSDLPEDWRMFNHKFIPIFLERHPEKSRIAAGLACGMLWTVSKGLNIGDIILSPDGSGRYLVGEVTAGYKYHPNDSLPHRRPVQWFSSRIVRDEMSDGLRHSAGSIGTVSNISQYADEIEALISGDQRSKLSVSDDTVENPAVFAMEQHLEEFLVNNWNQTELGRGYDIFTDNGDVIGQQYPSDTGPIDILAISHDQKTLLVIELKKGRASDVVVGQIQRYMGFVQDELVTDGQAVKGIIIALEDDIRLRRALSVTQHIEFYRYEVEFRLMKSPI